MSAVPSVPRPANEPISPFVPTTTPTIERANRLISLRANPGFYDLLQLSQELVQSAADICEDYPGWDAQHIVVLKVRMQAAKEHHALLIHKVQEAIEAGLNEARAEIANLPAKTVAETLDQGDFVRQKVLEKFEEYDSRPAGSHDADS